MKVCNIKIIIFIVVSSIDATHSDGCGRMLNDSRRPNCKVVVEELDNQVMLSIYTLTSISKGEEHRFDYNDKEAFWRRVSISNFGLSC